LRERSRSALPLLRMDSRQSFCYWLRAWTWRS